MNKIEKWIANLPYRFVMAYMGIIVVIFMTVMVHITRPIHEWYYGNPRPPLADLLIVGFTILAYVAIVAMGED